MQHPVFGEMSVTKKYKKWSSEEQQLFYAALARQQSAEYVKINYAEIARSVRTKTARQCYDFYLVHRDKTDQSRHVWTASEKNTLLKYGKIYQKDWERVKRDFFPHFSTSQLRNKFNHLDSILLRKEEEEIQRAYRECLEELK